ncbi:hypothetical protein QAD02_019497 [Eretmocerus hayati]|uniref:Uncharacterized protein n=1 Tax=Eretmocerus hayati TaxID=131215 RepID=A0ACC2PJU9_9HYME|nr:hypothetical protein QAD02_019497 [Eretmocerus hayati]
MRRNRSSSSESERQSRSRSRDRQRDRRHRRRGSTRTNDGRRRHREHTDYRDHSENYKRRRDSVRRDRHRRKDRRHQSRRSWTRCSSCSSSSISSPTRGRGYKRHDSRYNDSPSDSSLNSSPRSSKRDSIAKSIKRRRRNIIGSSTDRSDRELQRSPNNVSRSPSPKLPPTSQAHIDESPQSPDPSNQEDVSTNSNEQNQLNTGGSGDNNNSSAGSAPNNNGDLDEVALRLLGDDPSVPKQPKHVLRQELIVRWCSWLTSGLDTKTKNSLLEKYEHDPKLSPQQLNPEVEGLLSESAVKRDGHFVEYQKLTAMSQTALGLAISALLPTDTIDRSTLLEYLFECGEILSELHFSLLDGRKSTIVPIINKELRPVLEKAKTDEFLFGKDLSEEIKKAKIVSKTGNDLKISTQPKKIFTKNFFRKPKQKNTQSNQSKHFGYSNNKTYRGPQKKNSSPSQRKTRSHYPSRRRSESSRRR